MNPAEDAAAFFDEYCAQKFKKGAAEHATVHAAWLPGDMSAQGILSSVPVYNAQAAVRSALTMWVGVARECMAKSAAYARQHSAARAAVLPVIGQLVRDAEHASYNRHGTSPCWCLAGPTWLVGWSGFWYGHLDGIFNATATGLAWCLLAAHHGDFISAQELPMARFVASWLSRRVPDAAWSGHGERDWAQASLPEKD